MSDLWTKTGATPGKLVLIGILAIVLVIVLVLEFSGTSEAVGTVPALSTTVATPRRTRAAQAVVGLTTAAEVAVPEWPHVTVESVVGHNPFRLGTQWWQRPTQQTTQIVENASTAETPAAERIVSPDSLLRKRVEWIFVNGQQAMAGLGGRTVRVGDVIDGFRVSAIHAHGIEIVEAGQE